MENLDEKWNREGSLYCRTISCKKIRAKDLDELGEVEISKKKKKEYLHMACAFDIETTNMPYEKDEKGDFYLPEKYMNESIESMRYEPFSFMYHWQIGMLNGDRELVITGRRWEDWLNTLQIIEGYYDLNDNRHIVFYVHNLAFEFQFIQSFFTWEKVFARAPRKVITARADHSFEFRCSYFLSNMNLAKFCQNTEGVEHGKLVGSFDYGRLRTEKTKLSKEEKAYCINDVAGLCECIAHYLRTDNLHSIPLTSTGFVRREVRSVCHRDDLYWHFVVKQIPDAPIYQLCKKAFRGGDTHANRIYANKIMKNVYSRDIKSSYPAVMLYEEYPTGKAEEAIITSNAQLYHYCINYCCVFQIELFDVELKENVAMPYIDIAHVMEQSQVVNDNGRVIHADYALITITNVDWDIIVDQYDFSGYNIRVLYYWHKEKLPLPIREMVSEYFKRKTELDGDPEKKYEYLKSKNKLNSIFGMMVTALDMDDIIYEDNSWYIDHKELQYHIDRAKKNPNTFLTYQWGIFITAYARRALHKVLDQMGYDAIYIDTDSIKFIGKENEGLFEAANEEILKKAEHCDPKPYAFTRSKEKMVLGIWEDEGCYEEFKTLGAKKYIYKNQKKKKESEPDYIITVSGMNKDKGSKKIKDISDFKIGAVFDDIGRTTAFYNDNFPFYAKVLGVETLITPNVCILDTTYTLGVTDDYAKIILDNLNREEKEILGLQKKKNLVKLKKGEDNNEDRRKQDKRQDNDR